MNLLRQASIILSICFIGEVITKALNLIIPGSILGMIILLGCLSFKIINIDSIKEISDFLLKHLSFFFIPAGVGLLSSMSTLKNNWGVVLFISLISTVLIMATTGITVQILKRR